MKQLLLALLALLLLTACSAQSETVTEPSEPAFSLPETADAEPVSAEAIVTEGRAPAENYDLPVPQEVEQTSQNYWRYSMDDWIRSGTISILAETPDGSAAFYGLPYSEDAHETALIRWGDSRAEFDWDFVTPRRFLPRMAIIDLDGDEEDELIVLTYVGSGTGVSIYDLHVLEKNPDGTLTDYAMPESLWHEQITPLLQFVQTGGRNFLILGRELLEINAEYVLEGEQGPSTGLIAEFRLLPAEDAVELMGAVDLWETTNYVANYAASVGYRDGAFTLSGFHLQ